MARNRAARRVVSKNYTATQPATDAAIAGIPGTITRQECTTCGQEGGEHLRRAAGATVRRANRRASRLRHAVRWVRPYAATLTSRAERKQHGGVTLNVRRKALKHASQKLRLLHESYRKRHGAKNAQSLTAQQLNSGVRPPVSALLLGQRTDAGEDKQT